MARNRPACLPACLPPCLPVALALAGSPLSWAATLAAPRRAALTRAVPRAVPRRAAQCRMSPKKSAKLVEKALLSAQANAVNNQGLEAERLRVGAWPRRSFGFPEGLGLRWSARGRRSGRRCPGCAGRGVACSAGAGAGLQRLSPHGACPDAHARHACTATPAHPHSHPTLCAAEAWVGKGQNLKRTSMHGRGRSGKRLKYRSHLTVRPGGEASRQAGRQAGCQRRWRVGGDLGGASTDSPLPAVAPCQVLLREEEEEPRRRTRIVPMMAERHKLWRMREAQGVPQP